MMNSVHARGQLFEVWKGFTDESIETGEGQWLVYRRRSLNNSLGKWGAIQGASNAGCRRGRGRKNRFLKSAGEKGHAGPCGRLILRAGRRLLKS